MASWPIDIRFFNLFIILVSGKTQNETPKFMQAKDVDTCWVCSYILHLCMSLISLELN